jgi:hypothetical protein
MVGNNMRKKSLCGAVVRAAATVIIESKFIADV